MTEKTLYTIVVADDEDELREAVCQMIPWEDLGFRLVGSASNGLDALELVEQLEPDLLLTDIRMPFISGIELARQVREIRPAMHIAFLSGFDDFEYAKQAIQYNIISYMLKPLTMEGLARELTSIREKMNAQFQAFQEQTQMQSDQSNFLLPLLLDEYGGAARDEESLTARAVASGLLRDAADHPRYAVMVSAFSGENGHSCTTPATIHMVELVAEKYLRQISFYSSDRVITLLMANDSDFEEYLHILVSELLQVTERVLHQRCNIGVSRRTDALSALHTAYREAMDALNYAEPDRSNLCFITDMRPPAEVHAESMTALIERIESAFKSGNAAELARELDALIDLTHVERYGRDWLDMASLQLITDIYRVLYTAAGSEALSALHTQGVLPDIGFHYRTPGELRQDLLSFCTSAMELVRSQQKKGGSLLCQQALEAIDQHYKEEDLSLVSLSTLLNVSPNHLSSCIKKYAGESFINILIQKRMHKAEELLLTTPMKVLEIAQQCGYSDQHYFSYCFKKYCGASPNALRRQSAMEQNGGVQ